MQRMPWDDPQSFIPEEEPLAPASRASPVIDGGTMGADLTALQAGYREREQIDLSPDGVLKRAQEASIQQHNEYAQHLEQRQSQVNLQGADLELATRMAQITAPGIPKSAREYLLNREASRMGVDYKGESFKDFKRMLHGLDPDSLAALRSSFVTGAVETAPGALMEMTKSVFRGQADGVQLLGMIRASQPTSGREAFYAEHGPPMRSGAPLPTEEEGTAAPPAAVVPPAQAAAREKTLKELGTKETNFFSALNDAIIINEASKGNNAVLNWPHLINIPGVGPALQIPTGATARTAIRDALPEGIINEPEPSDSTDLPAMPNEGLLTPGQRYQANRLAARVNGMTAGEVMDRDNSARNALVRQRAGPLTANLAKAVGEGLSQLSTEERAAYAVPNTSDPAELENNLTVTFGALYEGNMVGRANTLNERVPFNLAGISTDWLGRYRDSPIVQGELRVAVESELQRRTAASASPAAAPPAGQAAVTPPPGTIVTPPTATTSDGVPITPPAQQATAPAAPAGQRTIAQIGQDERTEETRRRSELDAWVVERRTLDREKAKRDADALQLRIDEAKERGDERAYRRARDLKADAEKQQAAQDRKFERAAALIAQAGKILGSGGSGGGGSISGASGGDQDVAAFRITPAPQRSLPTPAPASGGMGAIPALSAQGPVGAASFSFPTGRGTPKSSARAPAGRLSGGAATEELTPFANRKRRKRRA